MTYNFEGLIPLPKQKQEFTQDYWDNLKAKTQAEQPARDAVANQIRAEEGAPSLEEERKIMKRAQQKENKGKNLASEVLKIRDTATGYNFDGLTPPTEAKGYNFDGLDRVATVEDYNNVSTNLRKKAGEFLGEKWDATTKAITEDPAAAAAGAVANAVATPVEFGARLAVGSVGVIKDLLEGKSMAEAYKGFEETGAKIHQAGKQAMTNVGSLLGEDAGKATAEMVSRKAFDDVAELGDAPFVLTEAPARVLDEKGSPNAAAGVRFGGEAAMGVAGGVAAYKGLKGKAKPSTGPSMWDQAMDNLFGGPVQTPRSLQSGVIHPELMGSGMVEWTARKIAQETKDPAEHVPKLLESFDGLYNPEIIKVLKDNSKNVVMMSPKEFLEAALDKKRDGIRESEETTIERSRSISEGLAGDGLSSPMILRIDQTGRVSGHNGRNRAGELEARGVERVPVLIDWDSGFSSPRKTIVSENGKTIPMPQSIDAYVQEMRPRKVNKGTFGQSGAIDISGGVKREYKETPKDNKAIRDHLYRIAVNSKDGREFIQELKLVSDDPAWQQRVAEQGAKWWDKKDAIIEVYGKQSAYSQLDAAAKRNASDERPFNQMLKEEGYQASPDADGPVRVVPAKEDVNFVSRFWNPSVFLTSRNPNKMSTKIMKNVVGGVEWFTNIGRKLFKDMVAHLEPFGKLSRDSQKKVVEAAIQFDGISNRLLTDSGLQWPTENMLRQKGLNDAEVKAYQEMTRGVDKSYDAIDASLRALDLEPVERIPGYFPHYWVGSYRVKGHIKVNGKMVPIMRAFETRWQAAYWRRKAEKNGLVGVEMIDPEKTIDANTIAATMYDSLMTYRANNALDVQVMQNLATVLARVDMFAKRGIIREVMERGKMHGHEAEVGLGVSRAQDNRLIQAYEKHMESASQFWVNTRVARDVLGPFLEAQKKGMFEKTPNLVKTVQEYIARANGLPVNHVPIFSEAWRRLAITAGLPPDTAGNIVNGFSAYTTFVRLRLPNLGYWGANVVQPVFNMNSILTYHVDRDTKGLKTGSMARAISEGMKQFTLLNKFLPLEKDMEGAVAWAWNNNKIDVYQTDHLNPLKNTSIVQKFKTNAIDWVPKTIEEHGRLMSFMTHYAYDRQVMPKEQAYTSAANKMNKDMGDYQNMSSPGMYTDFGGIGQSLRPFALLRNVYFGKLMDTVELIHETSKANGLMSKKTAKSTVPLTAVLSTYLLTAGAMGLFGMNEWDMIVRLLNQYLEPEVPYRRPGQILREVGLPDAAIYGVLGTALGLNIGPSIAAPAMSEMAGIPALAPMEGAATLLNQGRKAITPGEHPDYQKVFKAVRNNIPTTLAVPWLDKQMADIHGGVIPETTTFHGNIRRTEKEHNILSITGKQAISEVNKRQDNTIIEQQEKANKKWKSDIVKKIVDAEEGIGGNVDELYIAALENNRGFNGETLRKAIMSEQKKRFEDKETRRLREIMKSENTADKDVRLQIMNRIQERYK